MCFRSWFIFDRCLIDAVELNVVDAHRDYGVGWAAWRVPYESAAFFKAIYDGTLSGEVACFAAVTCIPSKH